MAQKTMGKGGKLGKGFCKNTYRKCRNINQQIGHSVSKKITDTAQTYSVDAIVFELHNLKTHKCAWRTKNHAKRHIGVGRKNKRVYGVALPNR